MLKGKIHSFQSLGAVDGPGVRYVIFMQGCFYKCPYCHNPDTRSVNGGREYSVEELVDRVKRYKSYFGDNGGVTVSGGEPLIQREFVRDFFKALKKEGINTALDTAGMRTDEVINELLDYTDCVLCDIKFNDDERYEKYLSMKTQDVLEFLSLCHKKRVKIIIRHVVVPQITDSDDEILRIKEMANSVCLPEKIELLPFKKMCIPKYEALGIDFPLKDTPECSEECIQRLNNLIKE